MKWSEYLFPINKGTKFNSSILANENIFTENLTSTVSPSMLRVYACLDTKAKMSLKRTQDATTVTEVFNSNNDLEAGCCYIFDTLICSGQSVNCQVSTNLTINSLLVVEIPMIQ